MIENLPDRTISVHPINAKRESLGEYHLFIEGKKNPSGSERLKNIVTT